MIRKILISTSISLAAVATAGCNTIDGAQEDVESVADEVGDEI